MNPWLVSGVTGAAPIWHKIMAMVLKDIPDEWPKKPDNVIGAHVCTWDKISADKNKEEQSNECHGRFEYFIKGTEKSASNGRIEKKEIWIDKETHRPPEPGKTDNLELQEHLVASDGLTQEYCLDCPHEGEKPIIINPLEINRKANNNSNN